MILVFRGKNNPAKKALAVVIKVIIAFSNLLFAKGVSRLLEGEKDIEVAGELKVGTCYQEGVRLLKPDIVLVDLLTLYNGFKDTRAGGRMKFILFDTTCGKENITSALRIKGVSGVLQVNATSTSLKKAIRTIASKGGR